MAVILLLILSTVIIFSCNTRKNEPTTPVVTVLPSGTPTPGVNGYYSTTTAGVTFQWKVVGSNLVCKLSSATTGWVAVGFNASAMMQGADLKIGYVTGGSTVFMEDDFGSGHTHQHDDGSGGTLDISSITGLDDGVTTSIDFTIPMNSGDAHDFALSEGAVIWLLLSHGPASADDYTTQHADRGAIQITLY